MGERAMEVEVWSCCALDVQEVQGAEQGLLGALDLLQGVEEGGTSN
jgi:hypothetical protein